MTGTTEQIQQLLDCNILQNLPSVIAKGDRKSQREIVWIIFNIASSSANEQILQFTQKYSHVVKLYCDLLISKDDGIVVLVLDRLDEFYDANYPIGVLDHSYGFSNLLVSFDIITKMKALETHENENIRLKASKIITKYFN